MVSFLHAFREPLISPQLENLCCSGFPPITHQRPKDLVIGAFPDGSVERKPCFVSDLNGPVFTALSARLLITVYGKMPTSEGTQDGPSASVSSWRGTFLKNISTRTLKGILDDVQTTDRNQR